MGDDVLVGYFRVSTDKAWERRRVSRIFSLGGIPIVIGRYCVPTTPQKSGSETPEKILGESIKKQTT